jgi:peptidoglycan hydrolase-like protein with peptidoglycan-binding domain
MTADVLFPAEAANMTDTLTVHKRRKRPRPAGLVAAVLVLGAVAAAVSLTWRPTATPVAQEGPPATAPVTRQSLRDTRSLDGELGHGPSTSLPNRRAGTITGLPVQGGIVRRGEALYRVDNTPVLLLYGALPAYRPLGTGDSGPDVRQLEENLKAMGFSGFTVDDTFSGSTANAVRAWQKGLGLEQTGRLELGSVVFAPGEVRVDSVDATLGQPATPGQAVLHTTGTATVVTLSTDVAYQQLLRKDTEVSVAMPDGQRLPGTVSASYPVIDAGSGPDPTPSTKIEAVITLKGTIPDGLDQAAVHVEVTRAEHKDVLTVPVVALVVLREGGYGVEVIEDGVGHYVAVKTGIFAQGRVEVSGDGLTAGALVAVPA